MRRPSAILTIAVLASFGGGCGGGGSGHQPAAAANGHRPGAGGSTDATDNGSGPPPGAGHGHAPTNVGGTPDTGGPPDRNPNIVRPGRWKLTEFDGEVVVHLAAPCQQTSVAYQPVVDPGATSMELSGDHTAKFTFTWTRAAAAPTPPSIAAQGPPETATHWSPDSGLQGQSADGALQLTASFDTPSQLVGQWHYASTAPVGSCPAQSQGQGGWSASPS